MVMAHWITPDGEHFLVPMDVGKTQRTAVERKETRNTTAQILLARVVKALGTNNYLSMLQDAGGAIKVSPRHFTAYFYKGLALLHLDRPADASTALLEARQVAERSGAPAAAALEGLVAKHGVSMPALPCTPSRLEMSLSEASLGGALKPTFRSGGRHLQTAADRRAESRPRQLAGGGLPMGPDQKPYVPGMNCGAALNDTKKVRAPPLNVRPLADHALAAHR